jgi:phospholipid/cholesterol/gamma-HCH transport system permease protein
MIPMDDDIPGQPADGQFGKPWPEQTDGHESDADENEDSCHFYSAPEDLKNVQKTAVDRLRSLPFLFPIFHSSSIIFHKWKQPATTLLTCPVSGNLLPLMYCIPVSFSHTGRDPQSMTTQPPNNFRYKISRTPEGMVVRPEGGLDVTSSSFFIRAILSLLQKERPGNLAVDLGGLTNLDEFGVAVLAGIQKKIEKLQGRFSLRNVSGPNRNTLAFYRFDLLGQLTIAARETESNIFVRMGEATLRFWEDQKFALIFLGSTFISLLRVVRHPRSLRWQDTIFYMQRAGMDAVPIIAMLSMLMGLIMAFMSSVQLKQFGADIYVASLVSLSMTRELGPIITAIIVAGRSSSAFAAEIGSMKVAEEVDALTVMGFDPHAFLVLPKVIATLLVVPILTLFSDVFAILGGLIVGVWMLDLSLRGYIDMTKWSLTLFDVYWGISKGAVFALLISWTGCLRGFQVKGGATAVGQAATSAVVTSIFIIILVDSIFAVLLTYWAPEKAAFLSY